MQAASEDFVIPFSGAQNDNTNFYGVTRDNYSNFRQSAYIVSLMDGTLLAGAKSITNSDPRIKHMLTRSADTSGTSNGGYRGVAAGVADANSGNRRAVPILWADTIASRATLLLVQANVKGKYVFADKAAMPVMTASEMQFMKAEAAFIKGDKAVAYEAYLKGINLHFDFINRATWPMANTVIYSGTAISAAERTAYLASANVKQDAASLTVSDIMLQKYIALWGWGYFETWVDMRRYHYTDFDRDQPTGDVQVYKGFTLPTLAATNTGRPVYRMRPRYNSEYVWNAEELQRLGGMNTNYHTYECWFSQQ
jgi:hypothetical protein